MPDVSFRDAASNAVRFWERGRIAYNLVLLLIVGSYFVAGLPASWQQLSLDLALGLFVMAVLANVAYSVAYPIDIFAQFTDFQPAWLTVRWIVLILGTAVAAVITRFFVMGMFAGPG